MRPLARALSALIEPLWYWLDLLGPDGRPANAKVIYTAAMAVALALVVVLGLRQLQGLKGHLSLEYVLLVGMVLLAAVSRDAFAKFMRLRWGGGNGGSEPVPPREDSRGE